jgi:RNA polymerase sigma-70 factor, ECF subfamily
MMPPRQCFLDALAKDSSPWRVSQVLEEDVAPGSGKRMAGNESDESLMTLVAQGDQRAFRILMGRYMGLAIRVAQRLVHDAAEADDIGQEAFLRVWRRAGSFDPKVARVTTWLYRIVLNLSLDRRRKPKPLPIDEAAEIRSDDPEPLAMMIENEDRHRVDVALAALPERQRVAIVLFHMEGLSVREAAQSMNVTEKALESLLVRARSAIKKHVESRDRINRRFA